MDLRDQEYVIVLARLGNLTKAAESLYISQPALSIFIQRLEKRMGVALFQKINKKFILTPAGEIYVNKAEKLLEIQEEFRKELNDLTAGYKGKIKIGIHRKRSSYLVPKILNEFYKYYPEIEIIFKETNSNKMEEMLIKGDLDLIITNRFFNEEHLISIPLYEDTLLAALPENHPACSYGIYEKTSLYPWLDINYLKDERFILQHPSQSIRNFVNIILEKEKIFPKKKFIIENIETGCQLAAEGYGVAFNLGNYAKYFHYSKPIRFFQIGPRDFTIHFSLAYRKKYCLPPYVLTLISLIKNHFNS